MPVPNTLAYLVSLSATKGKSFITLTPGVEVIKLFSSSLMKRPNKLEYLYPTITFQSILKFAGNTKSLAKKEASKRCSS